MSECNREVEKKNAKLSAKSEIASRAHCVATQDVGVGRVSAQDPRVHWPHPQGNLVHLGPGFPRSLPLWRSTYGPQSLGRSEPRSRRGSRTMASRVHPRTTRSIRVWARLTALAAAGLPAAPPCFSILAADMGCDLLSFPLLLTKPTSPPPPPLPSVCMRDLHTCLTGDKRDCGSSQQTSGQWPTHAH